MKQYESFKQHGRLITDGRGRQPGKSLIHDEDIKALCRTVISQLGENWSARSFRDAVSKRLVEKQMVKVGKKIGRSTASYWLSELGMECIQPKKGIYKDAHEREDVVEFRNNTYLPTIKRMDLLGTTYVDDENGNIVASPPILQNGQRQVVKVFHDECIYAANEDRKFHWVSKDQSGLFRKSKGAAYMVSGFICDCHGMMTVGKDDYAAFMQANNNDKKTFKLSKKLYFDSDDEICSFTSIEPGSAEGKDGWWDANDVDNQLAEVIPIFEWLHPNAEALFVFDNSTGHSARPEDALHVGGGVNKNAGGVNAPGAPARSKKKEVPKMRDGWFMEEDTLGDPPVVGLYKKHQKMHRQQTDLLAEAA